MENLGTKMKWAAAHSGISVVKMAERLGISEGSLRHYFNGRNEPKLDTLVDFAEITSIPVEDFLKRDGDNCFIDPTEIGKNDGLSKIDMIDAYLSAGAGAENLTENIIGQIAFPTNFLNQMGVRPSSAKIVKVNGSSMEPTLMNGSLVMVDMRDNIPTSKGLVFALRIGEETFVKRLEKIISGPLLVHSDNPQWQTDAYDGDTDIHVIGKVVWSARTWLDNQL